MSNIANQLIAVVATLLGFVAHDALTERNAPATVVASATVSTIDPIVTRSVDLGAISADWLATSPRAERVGQLRPAMRMSDSTGSSRPDSRHVEPEFADIRINDARVAAPGQRAGAFLR